MDDMYKVKATEWRTPLTDVKEQTVGNARLKRDTYARGYYSFEGTLGREFYQVVGGRLPVMALQRQERGQWKTWMVDDPLHWFAMGERVDDLPGGDILCGGLGLGLMLHHLVKRDDISSITVVDIDQDVIDLITPTIPTDDRIEIVNADYYEYITREDVRPSAILWDLAVGKPDETRFDFEKAWITSAVHQPTVPLFRFGERRRKREYRPL